MKKLLLFIGLITLILSCAKEQNKKVVLLGQLKNVEGIDSVYLNSQGELISVDLSSKLGDKGDFKFSLEVQSPGFYYLQFGKTYCELFLSPGDSINLNGDISDLNNSLTFSGKGAENNAFIVEIRKATPTVSPEITYALDEKSFSGFNDSLYEARNKMIDDKSSENKNITKEFVEAQKNVHLYRWATNYTLYKPYHAYYAKVDGFETSDKFNEYLKKVNLNDSDLLSLAPYVQFLSTYFQLKAQDEAKKDTLKYNTSAAYANLLFDLYGKEITSPGVMEVLTFSTLYDEVRFSGMKNIKEKVEKFLTETKNKNYTARLNAEIEKWKNCEPGIPMKDYKFRDINGKEVAFSSFKGKLIYIDVWATWCGPCKVEIPSLKKLEEKYKKDKIVFVSVSVDEDKQAWEKMVKDDKLQGIQVWAVSWKNELCQDFNINGIPRFILIDSQGIILDPDAERPSGKIDERIAGLLKQI